MDKVSIQELISRCIQYFKEHCYTENRISKYKSLWNTGILRYMAANGLQFYDPDVGESFKETCHKDGEVRHQEREKIRSVEVLNDLLKTGEVRLRTYTPIVHDLSGKIGEQMEKLIVHLVNLRRSKTTVNDYRLYLSEFLFHLKLNEKLLISLSVMPSRAQGLRTGSPLMPTGCRSDTMPPSPQSMWQGRWQTRYSRRPGSNSPSRPSRRSFIMPRCISILRNLLRVRNRMMRKIISS